MNRVTDQDLVDAVRAHAVENSHDDGWEQIATSWEDWEILAVIRGANRESQAIRRMKRHVRGTSDHRLLEEPQ